MALSHFLGRLGLRFGAGAAGRSKLSRIDDLLRLDHDHLEKPKKAWGGLNFMQLTEQHIAGGQLGLAVQGLTSQVGICFRLANRYWGQGNIDRARHYLERTLERHDRLVAVCDHPDLPFPTLQSYHEMVAAKCAALLLGRDIRSSARIAELEPGYDPWFKDALLRYCLGTGAFDANTWQAGVELWQKRGFPKYRIEEFAFYVKALTGQFATTDAMFAEHGRLLLGRSKRSPDAELLDGYQDSELVIDYLFAAVLTRIGWQGTYRHSWPNTAAFGSGASTTRQPDRFLEILALKAPDPAADTGIIADKQLARRYIDLHLRDQVDHFEGNRTDARRPDRERSKIAGLLKGLGWTRDPATLDLMQTYRMDYVLNEGRGDLQEGSILRKLFDLISDGKLEWQKMPPLFEKFVSAQLLISKTAIG